MIRIGSKYLAKLESIKQYKLSLLSGLPQESVEVVLAPIKSGRCNYDRCLFMSRAGADTCVSVTHTDEYGLRTYHEGTNFHESCLSELLHDKRLQSLN